MVIVEDVDLDTAEGAMTLVDAALRGRDGLGSSTSGTGSAAFLLLREGFGGGVSFSGEGGGNAGTSSG